MTQLAVGKAIWTSLRRDRRLHVLLGALLTFALWFWQALPDQLFNSPYSPVLFARDGELLGARLAADRQWRFPLSGEVPERFATALVAFEDRRFWSHPGVDPLALLRAVKTQFSDSALKSGGSTLTMQVIRLSRQNPPRTVTEKLYEMLLALRLELAYSKAEILALYAQHAPFGGNLVGLETAAWRYFGRPPRELSWAEAATLAVLPNAPALIHPGRSRAQLQQKRDRLLQRLRAAHVIDELDLRLALAEPLPDAAQPLPRLAPHLLDSLVATPDKLQLPVSIGPTYHSSIDANWQRELAAVLQRESVLLREQGVGHAAAIIIDNASGEVRAYLGNSLTADSQRDAHAVDLLQQPRSSGSILKPLLYTLMVQHGLLTPTMLVPDVPTQINGYVPENFDRQYRGAVPANEALALSLNIPAVRLLREFGVARFHEALQRLGLRTLFRPPEDYGLTLILGGAETTLWDIAGVYANLADVAQQPESQSAGLQQRRLRVLPEHTPQAIATAPTAATRHADYGPGAAWLTLTAMQEVNRPGAELYWRSFSSARPLAWKTGTSFGLRDAWAVGSTPAYTIAVWAGNASGDGVAGLSGSQTAAPLLFALLNQLPDSGWFAEPTADLKWIEVCAEDGLLPQQDCRRRHERVPVSASFSKVSAWHRRLALDPVSRLRVHAGCTSVASMQMQSWFVLPAAMEHFYRRQHPDYRTLPNWRPDCAANAPDQDEQAIGLLYPQDGSQIYIPIDLDGERSQIILEAVHRRADATLYWHLDNEYLGQTRHFHQWPLRTQAGEHLLTLVDDQGQRATRRFTVLAR
ncbi:MAG TPA: penicillin-binding protein 1C [Permianibacter sp.]|nr:penicillin-binding protein 1C [Permianibacter sp.]